MKTFFTMIMLFVLVAQVGAQDITTTSKENGDLVIVFSKKSLREAQAKIAKLEKQLKKTRYEKNMLVKDLNGLKYQLKQMAAAKVEAAKANKARAAAEAKAEKFREKYVQARTMIKLFRKSLKASLKDVDSVFKLFGEVEMEKKKNDPTDEDVLGQGVDGPPVMRNPKLLQNVMVEQEAAPKD